MQEWRVYSKKADFKAIGDHFGIDQVAARIIRNRDVEGDESINRYLNGRLEDLYDPLLMKDMQKAVEIIDKCIKDNNKIRIIGDYDIDGICSIYILFMGLSKLGADIDYDVPDRIVDGYGINENLILKAHDAGRDVIITCDNGIAAIEQIKYAKSLGMTVVVTDHHDVQYEENNGIRNYLVPAADAVVDPKQPDCNYPFKMLCGAGIAYKFICAIYNYNHMNISEADDFIQFAGIATIGDIVDLLDENRILVKEGLKRIAHSDNYGLNALITLNALDRENITAYHIGFVIGPCLNASGRLDTAKRALSMLTSLDEPTAVRYAGELKELNDRRKEMTRDAVDKAINLIDNSDMKDDRVLVIYLLDCHESIAGIVAGKIREHYYRPSIVLTDGEDGVKGSARSTESYNMFEKLSECRQLLTRFGGHPMAAGLSLDKHNIEPLRQFLNEHCNLSDSDMIEKIWIDVPMPIEYITEKVIEDLSVLAPYGKANPKPVFADKNLLIRQIQPLGKTGLYTKLIFQKNSGAVMEAVGFFPPDELTQAYKMGQRVSCTYYPEINEFRGKKKLQICVTGYKIEVTE